MDKELRELVEAAEGRVRAAVAKPESSDSGQIRAAHAEAEFEACAYDDVPALCAAVRRLSGERWTEREAWIEYVESQGALSDVRADLYPVAWKRHAAARDALVVLGVPKSVFF